MSTSAFDLTRVADALRSQIDAALAAYCKWDEGCPGKLQAAIRYSLLAPGKRFRPILALMSAEACGGRIDRAMPAACAVEMVHAYSLVHDDLPAMDDDDLRRGQPACHKKFGEATAILAGDALLTLAFDVLAREVRPAPVAAACCGALARAAGASGMVGGQADDVAASLFEGDRPTEDAIHKLESLHNRKTGAMISVALRLGALVAQADDIRLEALQEYGRCLGLAFQVTDDLLDVCGQEAVTGKRVGKDSPRGKLTFPGLLGVEESSRRAEQLVENASGAIHLFGERADGLEAVARYVLRRKR